MDTHDTRPSERLPIEDSPFSGSAASGRFFPGGGRREVLEGMASDLAGGIPIVTLTGDEGSGKTVLCRMLVERMGSGPATVYFPRTANSFEDVLKTIVRQLGLVIEPVPKDRAGLLQGVVAHLHDRDLRVLLIFDEAERIYLATLERVRKMLDLANQDGIFIQMVMSGRSGLHHNFRNLALVNFQPAEERHFSLEPLSEAETGEYLSFALRDATPEQRELFGRPAAASIFAASRGNFRAVVRLADELVQAGEARARFIPDKEEKKVRREKGGRRLKRPGVTLPKFTFTLPKFRLTLPKFRINWPKFRFHWPKISFNLPKVSFNRRYLVWGGGAACIVLALLLLRPEENTVRPPAEAERDKETSIAISQPREVARVEPDTGAMDRGGEARPEKTVPPTAPSGENNEPQSPPASTQAPADPVVVVMPQPPTPAAATGTEGEDKPQPVDQPAMPAAATAEPEKPAASGPVEPVVVSRPQVPPGPTPGAGTETEDAPVEEARQVETTAAAEPPAVEPASPAQPQPEVADIVESSRPAAATETAPIIPHSIKARPVVKHRGEPMPAVRETIASQPVKILRQEESQPVEEPAAPVTIRAVEQKRGSDLAGRTAESGEAAAPRAERPKRIESGDRIYASRVAAGASWFSGIKDDRYTVRLMVITSGDAEKKLKTMLGEKKYQEEADKFYILRRESNPGVQYVYYGEYPTMTAARNARNTIPEFLRGYRPYAMSVKGAVERAQQED